MAPGMFSLSAALILAIVATLLWLLSVAIKDASIVDIFWGPGFALIAWVCARSSSASGV